MGRRNLRSGVTELPDEVTALQERKFRAKLIWQERDGTMNAIPNMRDTHLAFAIKMVEQSIRERKYWRAAQLPHLKEEQRYRRALMKGDKQNATQNSGLSGEEQKPDRATSGGTEQRRE